MRSFALTFVTLFLVLSTATGCAVSMSDSMDANSGDAAGAAGTGGPGRGGGGGSAGAAGGRGGAAGGRGGTVGGYGGGTAGTGTGGGTAGAAGGVAGTGGSMAGTGGSTPLPATLTATKAGNGAGTITSAPAGISCGSDCSEPYALGTTVTLTAAADPGSTFTGWTGGGCTGTAACAVTLTAATTVAATFTLKTWAVTVTLAGTGGGTVTSTPAGVNCGTTCTANYSHGTLVTLSAAPNNQSLFTGWGGACTGSGTCTVTADQARTVTATFTLQTYGLTVTKAGTGAALGSVSSSPAGITCGTDCSEAFPANTVVMLTASAATGATFTGWGGACTGTGACSVTIGAIVNVTATFTLAQYTLTVSKAGTGTGTVTSSPAGISCGTTCSAAVGHNTSVVLTAAPASGSTFTGWSGGGCSGTGTCTVAVAAATTVTATFTLAQYTLTIDFQGGSTGMVVVTPGNTTFTADGTMMVSNGATVTLTWTKLRNIGFGGWGGSCSGFADTCTLTLNANRTVIVTFDLPNRAFVTSTTHVPGALGGLAGADAICQARATAANLSGTFRALLGTATQTAWVRLNGARGWARLGDSRVFGDEAADLAAGRTFYPLIMNEFGEELPQGATQVVTGAAGGAVPTCNTWSSTSGGPTTWGEPRSGARIFFASDETPCNSTATHLYCFEVARTVVVRPQSQPTSVRRAFLSTGAVAATIGVAGADARCQTEATAASLAGTYRALLAGNGTTAASRFSTTGGPWFRTDDVQLGTAEDLLSGTMQPWAPLSVRTDGVTHERVRVWTGAETVTTPGTAAGTCGGWTSTTSTTAVNTWSANATTDWFSAFSGAACVDTQRLFCLQQ